MVLIQNMYQNRGKGSTLFSNERSKKKKKCVFFDKRSIFYKKCCVNKIFCIILQRNRVRQSDRIDGVPPKG